MKNLLLILLCFPMIGFGQDSTESDDDEFFMVVENMPEFPGGDLGLMKYIKKNIKYPPIGNRSYGVNRAQGYGFDFDSYINNWNKNSIFMIQVESIEAVENIESLVAFEEVDAVMIGPLDISGSLGVPGQTSHPLVIEASKKVINACKKYGKSCGTQVADSNMKSVQDLFDLGHTFAILGSDLFVLWKWAEEMKKLIKTIK